MASAGKPLRVNEFRRFAGPPWSDPLVLRLKCPFGIRRRVAYHEMGHALVAASLPGVDPVHKVSIIPRGVGALG
jgi:hypothetical protein